jgi:putative ABC transport system permease protein
MYLPVRQCGDQSSADLVIRSTLAGARWPPRFAPMKPLAPNLSGNEFRTLQQLVDRSVSPRRLVVLLLGGFAAFALTLASLGIYGLIGIRMARGASARHVQTRIIGQTLQLAPIGMIIGVSASWALARSLMGLLFGVAATDPLTFLGMLLVFAIVATLAGHLRARRASRNRPPRRSSS